MSDDMNAQVSNAHVANAARRGMKRRHLLPEMLVSGAESDWIRRISGVIFKICV